MMLTDLADTLRAAGLQVVEEPGWKQRGHGAMTDVATIVCHHTGGLKDLRVVRDGRPGLDGPLAHVWLAQDGVWHLVAAGKCWHAGVVRDPSFANEHAIGIEAEATGVDPWPPVQYHSYAKGCAALTTRYGIHVDRVLGHKEVCAPPGRKSDPNFDMSDFRALVQRYRYELLHPTRQEDDMPLTDADVAKVVKGLLSSSITTGWQEDGTFDPSKPLTIPLSKVFAGDRGGSLHASAVVDQLAGRLVSLEQGLNTLTELVRSLAPPPPAP